MTGGGVRLTSVFRPWAGKSSPNDPTMNTRMCGILGIIAPRGRRASLDESQIVRMRDAMTARGPDGCGLLMRDNVALGHRRLAIRDLAGGSQPLVSADGRFALVYNGELYNDAELRRDLRKFGHQFRTQCDTETLLAAWQTWGSDCLARLRGMFAFGIYDFRRERLTLVRDRFGIKPLHIASVGGELLFASTVAALLKHPAIRREPNWRAVNHYLTTFRISLGRETLFKDIHQLRPAEMLTWDLAQDRVRIETWWDFPTAAPLDLTFDEAADTLEKHLSDATRCRLVSDVPVGMFLSGGVDSSTLASMLSEQTGGRMLGVCGGGEANDATTGTPTDADSDRVAPDADFAHARQCADHVGFDLEEVRVGSDGYRQRWEQLVQEAAQPLATPSDVIIHEIARTMRPHAGVVLGGEGADELLCGYSLPHWSIEDFRLAQCSQSGCWPGSTAQEREFLNGLQRRYGRHSFGDEVDHYFAANSLIPAGVRQALLNPAVMSGDAHDRCMADTYAAEFQHARDIVAASESQTAQWPRIARDREQTRNAAIAEQAIVLHRLNLEHLLGRLDQATMLASLEARVPFTDHHLVEFAFKLPVSFRIDIDPQEHSPLSIAADLDQRGSLRSKRLLRQIARRRMPPGLADRRKASFPTPVLQWLTGPCSEWTRDRLLTSPFGREVFRREVLVELAGNLSMAGMWLWPILNLLTWGDSIMM